MSQICTISKCNRKSRGLCDCCQQNLCLQHLNEHNTSLLTQLNPLTDEINVLSDHLKTLNLDQIIAANRQELERWRDDCHKQIDTIYESKCQELNQLAIKTIEVQRNKLHEIHTKIAEFINSQEATCQDIDLLKSCIYELQDNIANIEKRCISIDTRSLMVNETFVVIQDLKERELDISTLLPVYKTIEIPEENALSTANNDRHFLIYLYPNILRLLDHEMNTIKEARWCYGRISDMCWSSKLERFILFEERNIFLVDENEMSIMKVQNIEKQYWLSCTCSDTQLFATANTLGSSIMEFNLGSKIDLNKEWKAPITCPTSASIIDIVYKSGKLALMMLDDLSKSFSIELRFAATLDHIWSLQLDIKWIRTSTLAFRCCSLPFNEWLIMDHGAERLLQITKDGKIKKTVQYHPSPYRASLLNNNKLVVWTQIGAKFHRFQ